ncbi:MAG: SusC/RagA family TonB-linked outer membrane protein [Chitinophagaceae bacterium]
MTFNRLLLSLLVSTLGIVSVQAQTRTVVGKVLSAKDSSAVPNASVTYGTDKGVSADGQGNFSLNLPKAVQDLQVSALNFTVQSVHLDGDSVTVYLEPFAQDLDAVVVIGYGTTKKKFMTGSVASISSKDFNNGVVSTPEQLIQGKAAGVQITSDGGQPGGASNIVIRGGASLNSSTDPLVVVDGVPLDMSSIGNVGNPLAMFNPNDIETFTILKDANATAIYGSRASNGVIIITTKKGKSGKPVFNFTTTNSLSKAAKLVDVLSADQIRDYVNEYGSTDQIAMLGNYSTNWQKEIYRTAFATVNNLSVAGTVNKWLPYRLSVGYTDQSGILKRDNMKRLSTALNLSPRFFDNHLKVDLNLKGTYTRSFFANQSAIAAAIQFDPTQSPYDNSLYVNNKYGGYAEWFSDTAATTLNSNAPRNPLGLIWQNENIGKAVRSLGNLQLDYSFHFLPELHANANVGYDVAEGKGHVYVPATAAASASTDGSYTLSKNKYNNYVVEGYMSFNKTYANIKSNIDAVVGYGYYTNKTTTYNFDSYAGDRETVLTTPTYPMDIQEHRLLSYYGRLVYTFSDKYLLSGTVRRDGSSKFSRSNRWGTFPSFGFTWRTIDEGFMKDQKIFSDLKLRLSYGVTGQQDGIDNYSYQGTYYGGQSVGEYQLGDSFYTYYSPNAYVSDLKWETTRTYNVGLDYGFLDNRITGSIDYYYKKTNDLLATVNIPVGTNFSNQVTTNVGNMDNHGIEFSINAVVIQKKDLTWNVGYNLFMYKARVTNLTLNPDPTYQQLVGSITGSTGNYIEAHTANLAPYSFYVYKQLYGSDGKPLEGEYADLDGDGSITTSDKYYYHSPAPKATMGFTTSVTYKKWTASTVLRANIGNYMYNNVASNLSSSYNILSPSGLINNATTDIYNTNFSTKQYWSDYYVQNASFLKMDNITVGYNFGSVSVAHPEIQLSLSGTVQNVFTITKYKGLDPESNPFNGIDYTLYPRPRTYSVTVGVKF